MNMDSRTDTAAEVSSLTHQPYTPQSTATDSGSHHHRSVQVSRAGSSLVNWSYEKGFSPYKGSPQSKEPFSFAKRLYERWNPGTASSPTVTSVKVSVIVNLNSKPEDKLVCHETYKECFSDELCLPGQSRVHEEELSEVEPAQIDLKPKAKAKKTGSKRKVQHDASTSPAKWRRLRAERTDAIRLLREELPDEIKTQKQLGRIKVARHATSLIRKLTREKAQLLSQQSGDLSREEPCSSSSLPEAETTTEDSPAPLSVTDKTAKKHRQGKSEKYESADQIYRRKIQEAFDNLDREVDSRTPDRISQEQIALRAVKRIRELKKSIHEMRHVAATEPAQ